MFDKKYYCNNCGDWRNCPAYLGTIPYCPVMPYGYYKGRYIGDVELKVLEESAYHKGYLEGRKAEMESNQYKPKDITEKELMDKLKNVLKLSDKYIDELKKEIAVG